MSRERARESLRESLRENIVPIRPETQILTVETDDDQDTLLNAMRSASEILSDRHVPMDDRVGVYGDWRAAQAMLESLGYSMPKRWWQIVEPPPRRFDLWGVTWDHDPRIGPKLIAAWHRQAIIPPATVLRTEGIAYVSITGAKP